MQGLADGHKTLSRNKFLGTNNNLRLQKWCKFTENSGSVKIRILKIHDELASVAHCQQTSVFSLSKTGTANVAA